MFGMRRREFIAMLGGAATAWPLTARAQQTDRVRRIGVLMSASANDPDALAQISAFAQGLQERGWTIGGNVRVEYRWGAGDLDRFRKYAAELVSLAPDVIVATAGSIVGALQQASRTVPIVFVTTIDPVGGGLVESLARPQRHRFFHARVQHDGEMAGTPQRDRTARVAGRRDPGSGGTGRVRRLCRDPNRSAFVGRGANPDRRAQRR
jgi:ABC transporter substrate binding protein